MSLFRRGTVVVGLVVAFVLGAVLAAALDDSGGSKDLAVPEGWRATWSAAHVLEDEDVALAWGDRAGEDPTTAPDGLRFDPDVVLAQLQALHELASDDVGLGASEGPLAGRKLLVVVDDTWSAGPGAPRAPDAPAVPVEGGLSVPAGTRVLTRGAVVDGVPLLRVDPQVLAGSLDGAGAAAPDEDAAGDGATRSPEPSASPAATATPAGARHGVPAGTPWELARGVAEALQHVTAVAHPGHGLTPEAAATLRPAAAAYLATVAVPHEHAGVADLVAAPHLGWGSARHGQAGWVLLQHLGRYDSPAFVADLWTGSTDDEHALAAYARMTSANASALNRRVGQLALRAAVDDVPGVAGDLLDDLDPVLVARRTTPVEPAADDPGAYRVVGTFAPAAYGWNVVRLAPDGSGADVRVRVRGHAEVAPDGDAAWSFGLVALGPSGPRYSTVTTAAVDGELRLALRPGEDEVYLVVAATPTRVVPPRAASFEGTVRYPYEFRVAGAVVTEAPDPAGGHPHPNGGGWVDDAASVDPAAYVAPGAVVRGDAIVGPGVRLEGRAWVEAGAEIGGQVVVRDSALVRGTARLSGGVVVGGDAVVGFVCDAGEYTSYRAAAVCDGSVADTDVNPVVQPFGPGGTALSDGVATVAPEPTEIPSPTPGPSAPPAGGRTTPAGPSSPVPSSGVAAPPAAVPAGACTASYEVVTTWPGGMQAQLTVTATTSGVHGWVVTWTQPPGLELADVWGASFARSSGTVVAENLEWNGSVPDGGTVTFGFNGTTASPDALTVPQVTCTRTR